MLCITLWAHGFLLITLAIGANFYFAPRTLRSQIFVLTLAQVLSLLFQIPVKFGRTISSCPTLISVLLRLRLATGEHILISSSTLLLVSNFTANGLQNASCGVGFPCLARAREYTEFASAPEQMTVNCCVSQNLVCHHFSSPIGSCLLLFTSSTQCLLRLWRER